MACLHMHRAVDILRNIGMNSNLSPMLAIRDQSGSLGWFGSAWDLLDRVNWAAGEFDANACAALCDCFTFNYR